MSKTSSSKLPLYLRSNVSKDITVGSLVVNPNVDFKIYKVLVVSEKHIIVVSENLLLHKFKIKNYMSVNYVFNINKNIIMDENIPHTTLKVSQSIFDNFNKFRESSQSFCEIFDNDQNVDVVEYKIPNLYMKVNSKIIITSTKNVSVDNKDENDKSISWLDHYATIKLKNSNEKIYLSLVRTANIIRK